MAEILTRFSLLQDFMVYGDRLMRILAEEALCRLPNIIETSIETPCGTATGPVQQGPLKICLVSVVRSGRPIFFHKIMYL